MLTTRHTIE